MIGNFCLPSKEFNEDNGGRDDDDNRELTKQGRRRLRGLHLKIQVRVIHITTKLFHVASC